MGLGRPRSPKVTLNPLSDLQQKQGRRGTGIAFIAVGLALVGITLYYTNQFGVASLVTPYPLILVALVGVPFLLSGAVILREPRNPD